jgi:hypothetical protein
MTKNGKTTFVILFSIGFLGAVWSRHAFAGGSAMVPSNIDSLTRKYCKIFGVPVSLMLAIMGVESSYNPRASNTSERAMKGAIFAKYRAKPHHKKPVHGCEILAYVCVEIQHDRRGPLRP